MLKPKSFAVLGGDLRQKYLASYLMKKGYAVHTYHDFYDDTINFNSVRDCILASDGVILPLPITQDNRTLYTNNVSEKIALGEILNENLCQRVVFGGKANETVLDFMAQHHITFHDYFKLEDMSVKNAIATAEGATAIAIQSTKSTLFDSQVLVAGYGRIGKALTKLLIAFGAHVSVAVRSHSQGQWAKLAGASVLSFEELKEARHFSLVFNTVPHIVFTKPELHGLDNNTLLIDLASFPGGVDLHQATTQGIEVITASALPSKFSPQSAGEFIAQSIINIIKEEVSWLIPQ